MRSGLILCIGALMLLSCGDSETGSSPGALVDNLDWTPTTDGEEFFGVAPEGATCPLEPEGDCPVPEDDCVVLPSGGVCITSFIAECLDQFTVLSVYTQRPDGTALCNWVTLEQTSLRPIRAGDEIEVRAFYFPLTSPIGGEARVAFAIGDELVMERTILIPQPFDFITESWVATKDFPVGTRLLFHVDNHGNNEYGLVEVNICNEREDDTTPCFL